MTFPHRIAGSCARIPDAVAKSSDAGLSEAAWNTVSVFADVFNKNWQCYEAVMEGSHVIWAQVKTFTAVLLPDSRRWRMAVGQPRQKALLSSSADRQPKVVGRSQTVQSCGISIYCVFTDRYLANNQAAAASLCKRIALIAPESPAGL